MKEGISVIICCYNSEATIEPTIAHVAAQNAAGIPGWELVLVDNNCTDKTVGVSQRNWQDQGEPAPLVVVREKKPGLIFARKKGIEAASFRFCVFCDDDNFLDANYLSLAYGILSANSKVGILGGRSVGYFSSAVPAWFTHVSSLFAVGKQADATGDVTESRGHLWGAGMCMPTALAREVLAEPMVTTGRKGKSLASGEDSEISFSVIRKGYRLYYDERLTLQHWIVPRRLTWEYTVRLTRGITDALVMHLALKKLTFEGKTESFKDRIRDFAYVSTHYIKPSWLGHFGRIINIKKHEGDMELLEEYQHSYYVWAFFKFKVLKKS